MDQGSDPSEQGSGSGEGSGDEGDGRLCIFTVSKKPHGVQSLQMVHQERSET